MNKNILIVLILIFLFATVLVCVFRPKTHKPIAFEGRNFKLELISDEIEAEKKSEINIQPNSIEIQSPSISINSELSLPNVKFPDVNTNVKVNSKPTQQNKAANKQKTQIVSKQQKSNNNKVSQQNKEQKVNTPQKPKQTEVNDNKNANNEIKKTEKIVEKTVETQTTTKVLTEEEEIIAWNKWRSDLQNKLMRDSKISAPIGTTFEFSFTVDKFGTISNLKTWSSNPSYTPLAVRVIKPLLLSYQKTAILNFPTGSKRVITNVNGGFTMARSSRFSSPSDYNDYERVTK